MNWPDCLACFFGGTFLANAIPHWVSGLMGRPFPSPFSKPPGRGLSSPVVNVLWGFCNLVFAYLLLVRVGNFDFHSTADVTAAGLGVLVVSVMCACLFGRLPKG